ncbi:flagellar hook capping FlgD N-terminal domain-containing protein [Nocardioides sp. AE5]|uniref:flagellar hook capping FlgD N-terminal domain-containing protein n=1 Tax=Nocardioides sp. AE5 TaxID=2962573 RepID=UPI0028812798|nr:flagellar hook capping FlgD N-terminal domain-containing protein [Nocardioides sp. AE5]MDT0200796.1 flagellar hook capping FlgD N-terminal domain-containing protein [Nocardioides sp. AE5]
MSIPATEAVSGASAGMFGQSAVSASAEDKQMFLELMVAQLRYQDPLNPTDSSAFLAQTAQFNSLEQMTKVAEATTTAMNMQLAFGASGLVGKDVTWTDADGNAVQGRVSGVTFSSEGPLLDVDGTPVALTSIAAVRNTDSAA